MSAKSRSKPVAPLNLAEIGYGSFRVLLKKELLEYAPDLLFMIGEQLAERLLTTRRKFADLVFLDVEGRIARTLIGLMPSAARHDPPGWDTVERFPPRDRLIGWLFQGNGRTDFKGTGK